MEKTNRIAIPLTLNSIITKELFIKFFDTKIESKRNLNF